MAAPSEALVRWDRRARGPIVVAALAPLVAAVVLPAGRIGLLLVVDLAAWAVFVVDLAVRLRLDRRYLRSGVGLFDLFIVVFTFPWYVVPAVGNTAFLAVFRLARLLRLATATRLGERLRFLLDRLGPMAIVLAGSSFVSSIILLRAEPPEAGFRTLGDTLWWSIVTFTTVGFGDLVPTTPIGRFAGVIMMLVGLAALGTVAGALASMFGGEEVAEEQAEIALLRAEVARLAAAVERLAGE